MTQIAVISDIHGNLPALNAVLSEIDQTDAEQIICAGDIVGILGWNSRVVELVNERCRRVVFGNHDKRIFPDTAFNPSYPVAQDELELVETQLDQWHQEWLYSLPERISTPEIVLAHARPFFYRDPGYPVHGMAQGDEGMPPREFTRIGPHLDGRTAVIGHTHEQHVVDCSKFQGQDGLVLNPGSVGVPWDGDAEFAVFDTETHDYSLHSVEFDNSTVRERLSDVGCPVTKYKSERKKRRL